MQPLKPLGSDKRGYVNYDPRRSPGVAADGGEVDGGVLAGHELPIASEVADHVLVAPSVAEIRTWRTAAAWIRSARIA